MITSAMNKREVNREIIRVLPELMGKVLSKSRHRDRQARKKGYPDTSSSYHIHGVEFIVFYFFDQGYDVNTIFCRYYDNIGPVFAYLSLHRPGQYSILHFLKHSVDRYNSRLDLCFDKIEDILYHMAKHGLTMVRQDVAKKDENFLDVFWRSNNGLWLGESESIFKDINTHVNVVKTFIDLDLKRPDQEVVLDDDAIEKLIAFEQSLGGDDYARSRVSQIIDLFTIKKSNLKG